MHPPEPASAAWTPSPNRQASDTDSDHLAIVPHRLHPVTVPPPLDQLLIHLAEDRDGALALGRSTDHSWLLPGTRPGRPRSPRQLRTRLASYGLLSRLGRNSALIDLAAQMPPAVLSEVLGVSIGAATGWAAAAGDPRAQYAADLSRRSKSGDQGRILAVTPSKNGGHGVSE
ncbi:hypothetical protein SRB17_78300 [Streptomyces sp. RB17]|uniref:hypothetical protein n=1 Tax=Streptomyces sp. RB17 TaxID=2585197 RepID=UPI00130CE5CE|nr:hypothetical protein [Streptomyces sp. RB17]MQY39802.1 hypothetical protein [Streptomyces sp. RB17]